MIQQQTNSFSFSELNVFPEVTSTLGEGPVWHHAEQVFYWIDISGKMLHRLDLQTGEDVAFDMGSMIGAVVPVENGGVVVAMETGIYSFNAPYQFQKLVDYPSDVAPNTRFNDGKCDPSGRLWIGTMDKNAKPYQGKLYRMDHGNLVAVLDRISISNGLGWSPDQQTMYYIDTFEQAVYAFDFDSSHGGISNKRIFITIPESMGSPDGMTVDSTGKLWIALWGGSGVACFDPQTRKLLGKIEVPALNVTSCEFGGPDLKTLLITTAKEGLNEEQLQKYPLSGQVLYVHSPICGIKSTYWIRNH